MQMPNLQEGGCGNKSSLERDVLLSYSLRANSISSFHLSVGQVIFPGHAPKPTKWVFSLSVDPSPFLLCPIYSTHMTNVRVPPELTNSN